MLTPKCVCARACVWVRARACVFVREGVHVPGYTHALSLAQHSRGLAAGTQGVLVSTCTLRRKERCQVRGVAARQQTNQPSPLQQRTRAANPPREYPASTRTRSASAAVLKPDPSPE